MIDLSIIVPVYNCEHTIRRCLDSVLTQSGVELEVICIDDASQDHSLDIVKNHYGEDSRVQILSHKKNMGAAASRNAGLELAVGQYVMNLDADDYLKPNVLQALLSYVSTDVADMCFYKAELIFADGRANRSIPQGIEHDYLGVYTGGGLFERFIESNEFFYYCALVLYRTEYIREQHLRYRELFIGEGGEFILRALVHANRVKVYSPKVYNYCVNANSVTNSPKYKTALLAGRVAQYASMLIETKFSDLDVLGQFLAVQRRLIAGGVDGLCDEEYDMVKNQLPDSFSKEVLATFTAHRKSYSVKLSGEDISRIRRAKQVYLYGAGYATGEALHVLSDLSVAVEGIVVTDRAHNPGILYGHRVIELRKIDNSQTGIIFVICLNKVYFNSVKESLREHGFDDYINLNVTI